MNKNYYQMTEKEKQLIQCACQTQISSLIRFMDINNPQRILAQAQFPEETDFDQVLTTFIEELEDIQEEPESLLKCSWFNKKALKHIIQEQFPNDIDYRHISSTMLVNNILLNLYAHEKLKIQTYINLS